MIIKTLRIFLSASLIILASDSAEGFSLPAQKSLCEVVSIAETVVVGKQTNCSVPEIEGPQLPGGPYAIVEFSVQETLLGSTLRQGQIIKIDQMPGHCLEPEHTYILLLRQPIKNYHYFRAYGHNDILSYDQKEEVLGCIKEIQK